MLLSLEELYKISYDCLMELATPQGMHASGKNEAFGCIFGRDSFITILKLLRTHRKKPDKTLVAICKQTLLTHIALQGRAVNLESGEQPGKFIHEYRKDNYDRLINRPRPWYVYPDNQLRNFDSVDSTPLGLIALHQYWKETGDKQFLASVLPAVKKALTWIVTYGDFDNDSLVEYELPSARIHGGLVVQSWADSAHTLVDEKGKMPVYPIAPVEVQGISWLALRIWADFYTHSTTATDISFGKHLLAQATALKKRFNETFIIKSHGLFFAAQALDGRKKQITTITANPLICLWAAYEHRDGTIETIIEEKYITDFVKRAFQDDLFHPHAGIRTMSSLSPTFNPKEDSYHNGSFWPMLNGLIIEGLENFSFYEYAAKLRDASLLALQHFGTPIELYIHHENTYIPYKNARGQISCFKQAWSAASMLDMLTLPAKR